MEKMALAPAMAVLNHPLDTARGMFGELAFGFQGIGRAIGEGVSVGKAMNEMDALALGKEKQEARERAQQERKDAGTKAAENLESVPERIARKAAAERPLDYSDASKSTGVSQETFRARAETGRRQELQAFNAQFQNPYERINAESELIGRQRREGTLTETQAYRAGLEQRQQFNAAVAPVRSNRENLEAGIGVFGRKWNDPAAEEARHRQAPEQWQDLDRARHALKNAETLPADQRWANYQETIDVHKSDLDRKQRAFDQATAGFAAPEQRDAAREMGDKLTDYVESMTRSGPLAGAADINSAAGYSQVVQAEYGMDQSRETMRMVELLITIAENTGRMSKDQGNAVIGNLGFRTADPILGR
jgi:hypothetical protein